MIERARATPYVGQTSFNVGMSQLSKYLRPKAGLDAPLPKRQLLCSGDNTTSTYKQEVLGNHPPVSCPQLPGSACREPV